MQRRLLAVGLVVVVIGCAGPNGVAERPRPQPAPVPTDRRVALAEGVHLVRTEQYDQAAIRFRVLVDTYPELADYHLYYLGVSLAHLNDSVEAAETFRLLLTRYPQTVWRDQAALDLGRIESASHNNSAARIALSTAESSRDAAVSGAARLELARIDMAEGKAALAAVTLQQLRRAAPGEPIGLAPKQALRQLRTGDPSLEPTGPELLNELRLLVAERDYAAADSVARRVLPTASPAIRGEILRLDAQALLGLGRVDDALTALRAAAAAETGATATATEFRIASTLWNRDRDREALVAFREFRRRYPRAPQAAEALYAIGRIDEKDGQIDAAITAYRQLAREGTGRLRREAQWRIAWVSYANARWPAAASAFGELARCSRIEDCADAHYWQARTLERQGNPAAARALYQHIATDAPTSYYAMWAEQRLGGAPRGAVLPTSDEVPALTIPPSPDYHLLRARELGAAGLSSLARHELQAYQRDQAGNVTAERRLLGWYPAVGGYPEARALASRLGRQAGLNPDARERLLYPLGYWTLIKANAQSLDPLLVAALIRQESLYDSEARSPADARGLMQLLPSTAARVAGRPVSAADLYEPEPNIELGTRYLRQLLARFHGDELKALAAYNGGEAAVEKWEQRFAGRERDEFVESISFRETRDYVKKVVAGRRRYRRLYGGG